MIKFLMALIITLAARSDKPWAEHENDGGYALHNPTFESIEIKMSCTCNYRCVDPDPITMTPRTVLHVVFVDQKGEKQACFIDSWKKLPEKK